MLQLRKLVPCPLFVLSALLCSCGGGGRGGGGGSGGTSLINVLSPANSAVVKTSTVTVRVQGADWEELWVESSALGSTLPGTQSIRTNAHPFDTDSFALGVPVWDGATRLIVSGRKPGGQLVTRTLQVSHPATGVEGVRVAASPSTVNTLATPVDITASFTGIGAVQAAWIDADGDGQLDASIPTSGVTSWTYASEGYFVPRVVVRAVSGLYHDSVGQSATVMVTSAPTLAGTTGEFDLPTAARDVADDRVHREVLVLTQDSHLHVFNESGALVASYTLQQVQDLAAIDVDPAGDVYAVDRALHQLRKFSRASGFAPDTTFGNAGVVGSLGTSNAQFDEPADVQCLPSVDGVHVWVADSGNQRLQRFSGAGAFQLQLPTGADIAEPVTLVADFAGHVTAIDGVDGDLAVFELNGTRIAYRPQALGVDPNHPLRASVDVDFGVQVADPAGRRVVCYDREGVERTTIDVSPAAPLAFVHVTGRRLLAAVSGATRLERLHLPEPAGESPVEVVTRFLAAIHQSSDATALGLLATETSAELTALLADPVKGPAYRDLAGRVGSPTELSRSERQASVHLFVDPGTPQAEPVVIELRRDVASNRWLVLGL